MEGLQRRMDASRTVTPRSLYLPTKRKHHLIKQAVQLKRHLVHEVLRWKIGKAASSEFCVLCGERCTKNHMLGPCGDIEERLEALRVARGIPEGLLRNSNKVDNILWWADTQEEPQMAVYGDVAKLLAEAKTRITGRVNLHEVGTYSGDEDEEDPLNVALRRR